ncbi:MAG: diadenylate cyclase CdaA [Clostridia bacterium]|nr:diadenylate cyclase CdaA [Clostridia bacterium]
MKTFEQFFKHAFTQFFTLGPVDILDIALVAVIIFFVIKFISDKRAGKLAIGICMILFLLVISEIFQMSATKFLFSNITQVGIILLVVVFQPELRSALEKIGGAGKDLKILPTSKEYKGGKRSNALDTLCLAVQELAADSTGALIVIERDTPLGDIAKSGTVVNADISVALVKNIFFNKAALHDGAMIVRNQRIFAAGCFLPLSTKEDIIKDLGTRHRAAIGMSENSDAIVIVVSEETGTISVAVNGTLRRNYDYKSLKKELGKSFHEDRTKQKTSPETKNTSGNN